jgi:hypothetical protein
VSNVLLFKAKAELTVEQNLAVFVQFGRENLKIFGENFVFDENSWDLTQQFTAKGQTKTLRAVFSSYSAARSGKQLPALSTNFIGFAKAYFRYSLSLRSSTAWANKLAALRVLDDALNREGYGGNVHKATFEVFASAGHRIAKDYQPSTAPKIAGELDRIGKFLIEHDLCLMKSNWDNPIRRPNDVHIRVGAAADMARQSKLPSKEAIEAVAYIFRNPTSPAEVFTSSCLAIMHCFPQRINDVIRLPFDCEVEYDVAAKKSQYGLREPGSKGYNDCVRWIIATMEPVGREAISKLKVASGEARKVALWYEANPGKIFIATEFEYLRAKKYLTQEEVSLILYGVPSGAKDWCRREKIATVFPKQYLFSDVEEVILRKLPKDFPNAPSGLKYSETLFIARRFELDATLSTYMCIVDFISHGQLTSRLGKAGSATSMFGRHDFKELDGSPISMNSHQIRHYLNTLAQSNNASQLDIAMWSGRADVSQNSTYDHVSHETILAKTDALAVAAGSTIFTGGNKIPKIRVVAHRDDATGKLITCTAHATLYGMCIHVYSSSPCQLHRDCLNCHEHVCVKGDDAKLKNIRRLRDETKGLLMRAELAEKNSVNGASRWVVHQRETVEHCDMLIAILSDPAIADGALVALKEVRSASRFEQVDFIRQEGELAPRKNKLLERMRRG